MKRINDIMAVMAVAVVTAALVVGTLAPKHVTAEGEKDLVPVSVRNELTADGCTFTLTTDKEKYAPGATPVLRVEVNNPTDKPVETKIWVTMTSQGMASMLSRRAIVPSPVWSSPCYANLAPGESKKITLETKTPIKEKEMVSFNMSTTEPAAPSKLKVPPSVTQNQAQLAPLATASQAGK